jgi:CRP-like cAMP-binding protein
MRQVFLQKPWIYHKEPQEIVDIFYRFGTLERLKRGTSLLNGGDNGCVYYLKKGLATFSFQDKAGRSFVFALVPPGRVLADIDGISGELVNVHDSVIRPSEVLSIDRETWFKYIGSDAKLLMQVTKGIISKHESHMEAMIANYTLSLGDRLKVLYKVLITSFNEILNEWNKLPLYLSANECAELTGATRVSISRIISAWMKQGLLKKVKRDIFIHINLFNDIYDWQCPGLNT